MPARAKERSILSDLTARLGAAGFMRVEPDLLIAADLVRDLVGDRLARQLFLTTGPAGEELCLRPDYTIPVVQALIETGDPAPRARASYAGPVFRLDAGTAGEIAQAGAELIGEPDREAADAEILALALDALGTVHPGPVAVTLGDVGVFLALVRALDLPAPWRRRLIRDFRRGGLLDEDLARLSRPAGDATAHAGLLAALEGSDPRAARALVTDLLSIAGISTVGGRSAADITERFLEQAQMSAAGLSPATLGVVRDVLSVEGPPEASADRIATIIQTAGLDLSGALEALDRRNALLRQRHVDLSAMTFSTRFGRDVDYYTGLVFEVRAASRAAPLVGGGRYDRLTEMMTARMGRPAVIPAVGCAFFADRIAAAGVAS